MYKVSIDASSPCGFNDIIAGHGRHQQPKFFSEIRINNDEVKTKTIFKSIVVTNTLLKRIMKILK
jgi:hypothetical protein